MSTRFALLPQCGIACLYRNVFGTRLYFQSLAMTKRILIAPLDWGLGHATRCIPIIQSLVQQGHTVYIASSGLALPLLQEEFPQLTFFTLPSYKARYGRRIPFMLKVFWQVPYFLRVIRQEHKQIEKLVRTYGIDLVIADNRYGCYSQQAKSIFITHQLNLQMPSALHGMQGLINMVNHYLIRRFDACWVPDFPDHRLSGILSQARNLPVSFMGVLSRFVKPNIKKEPDFDLLVLLSGPEPQRTLLEEIVLNQLRSYQGRVMLVRGLPGQHEMPTSLPTGVKVLNHAKAQQLQSMIESSACVLARSGYTTVMDLYVLEKRAIFIPTPGQTEQEYLAQQLMQQGIAFSMPQKVFNLQEALTQSRHYSGFQQAAVGKLYLEDLLQSIGKA